MAYPDGFNYVSGPYRMVYSTLSSTCTARARNPVTFSDDRTLIEVESDSTAILGIIQNDSGNSIPGIMTNRALVMIPTEQTIFATKVQTGVVASAVSFGQGYAIEKNANHFRLDTDSQVTAFCEIVGDDYGNTIRSDDSSVFVRFYADRLLNSSSASIANFAQN